MTGPLARSWLRVARPSRDLAASRAFYVDGLGLPLLGGFEGHEGFDGFMAGYPERGFHVELTYEHDGPPLSRPSPEDLVVFYLADADDRDRLHARMTERGYPVVPASNPYWDRNGRTYEDPDGYRVVVARPAE